ncbi:MAG TPA: hypothetical protein VHW95_18780 [Steroidobacteraceae bacterium]|jgi:hypothetical protein|nr:hypothetical protein [Steroidobacteraceae bacterium]
MSTKIAQRKLMAAGICCTLLATVGCQKTADGAKEPDGNKPSTAAKAAAPKSADSSQGLNLTPAQIEKIGLETEAAKTVDYAEESAGYGSVIPHLSIAQAVAELASAEAAEKQSRSAVARTQRLAGTAGALSADVQETNARQLAVDSAALNLARQRLSATYGQKPPWSNGRNSRLLQELAGGGMQLIRVTFPLGSLPGDLPKTLSISRLGSAPAGKRLKVSALWSAPADASVPGRSFFAVLRAGELGEGERLIAWAPIGAALPGVLIPAKGTVISDGKYWCYIEATPGSFVKTEISGEKPFEDGYVVTQGVKAGDKVVTTGAAQLLAQESNPGAD